MRANAIFSKLAMLDNLDIGAGPRAGTGGTYVPEILKVLGLSARIGYGSWDDMTAKLLSGQYNALVLTGGAPFPAAKELEAKEPLTFLSPSADEIASAVNRRNRSNASCRRDSVLLNTVARRPNSSSALSTGSRSASNSETLWTR